MATATADELLRFEISSSDIKGLEEEDSKGAGSYGAVYAVTVRGIPRIAKRLHNILVGADVSPAEKEGINEKFLTECRLLSRLDHPNVVKFVGVHFKDGNSSDITLIMERLHMDLEKFLDTGQPPNSIDIFTKLSVLLDVSSGLLYLHTHFETPIIHRDLTAGNVLLTEDFKQAKIADLGVSKLIENHAQRAATRTVCPGTQAYMPPEALRERPKYDTPLDVFSFGHLALYLSIQQFPVVYEISPEDTIEAYQTGEVAIRRRQKWINMLSEDHCLRQLILSCLRDDPRERPTTESLNVKLKVLCGLELKEFEIKEVVGIEDDKRYGSFGAVCEVICRGAPRIAKRLTNVIKMQQNVSSSQQQSIREKFHDECLALSKFDHPNILKFVGVYFNPSDRSDMAVIMERLFMDLEKFFDPDTSPDIHLNTKLSILLDVSTGMLYLHTQLKTPYVHGELIAANILLTEDVRQAKIADLGASKLSADIQRQGRSLAYLPPEAFSNDPKYDTPLDIFSFGHLALYIALQEFPEVSNEQLTVSRKKQEVEVLKRKKWIDQLPRDHCLRDLILSCLKDKPEIRPNAVEVNSIVNALYSKNGGISKNEVCKDYLTL